MHKPCRRGRAEHLRQLRFGRGRIEITRDDDQHVLSAVKLIVIFHDLLAPDFRVRHLIRRMTVGMRRAEKCGPEVRTDRGLRVVLGRLSGVYSSRNLLCRHFQLSVNDGCRIASDSRSRPASKSLLRNSDEIAVADSSPPPPAPPRPPPPPPNVPPKKSRSSANCSAERLVVPRRNKPGR